MRIPRLISALAISALSAPLATAQVQWHDDFNTDTSANYAVVQTADAVATFAWDYSTMGIPVAPNTHDGTTLGLKMEANVTAGASNAVTLHTNQTFTGDFVVRFDAWMNANGPFPAGGGGSTEFMGGGVGGDGTSVNRSGATGSGGWFYATGEGGSSYDYRAYKGSGLQYPGSGQYTPGTHGSANNCSDPYYARFGNIDVGNLPVQGANMGGPAQQNGIVQAGAFGFAWHQVVLTVDADGGTGGATSVNWAIDGLSVATLDAGIGAAFATDGTVTIGYMDIYSSLSDNPMLSFGVIDNLTVGVNLAASRIYGTNPAHPTFGAANLMPTAEPVVGMAGEFDLSYAASGPEQGVLLVGLSRLSLPLFDGTLLVGPPIPLVFPFPTTPPMTTFNFSMPQDPSLYGGVIMFQAAIQDMINPQTPFGFVLSDGLEWTLGY